jgi:hypothetical protein
MDVYQFSHLSLTFCRSFLQVWHLGVLGFTKTKSIVSTLRTLRSEAASPMLSEPGERLARSVEWNTMAALKLLHRASSVERRGQAIGNICFDFEPQRRATKLSCIMGAIFNVAKCGVGGRTAEANHSGLPFNLCLSQNHVYHVQTIATYYFIR